MLSKAARRVVDQLLLDRFVEIEGVGLGWALGDLERRGLIERRQRSRGRSSLWRLTQSGYGLIEDGKGNDGNE